MDKISEVEMYIYLSNEKDCLLMFEKELKEKVNGRFEFGEKRRVDWLVD